MEYITEQQLHDLMIEIIPVGEITITEVQDEEQQWLDSAFENTPE